MTLTPSPMTTVRRDGLLALTAECILVHRLHAARDLDIGQGGTFTESPVTDVRHPVKQRERRQRGARAESILTYRAAPHQQRLQRGAAKECHLANLYILAVTHFDVGERRATTERTIAYPLQPREGMVSLCSRVQSANA